MAKVTLIGAAHSDDHDSEMNRKILNQFSDHSFYTKYGQCISNSTLFISEGSFDTEIINSSHSSYLKKLERISPLTAYSRKKPDLLVIDNRYSLSVSTLREHALSMQVLQNFITANIQSISFYRPNTMGGAITAIAVETCRLDLKKALMPPHIKTIAQRFLSIEKSCDELFLGSILKYYDTYENIFVILGSNHILSITKQHAFDTDLMDSYTGFTGMFKTYMSYLTLRELPKLLTV